ncbi:bifunctional DNA-formamidopyrimidine glycosylase/DNA-(apurinic or apyrimidinic site) lyase [Thiomicrorhabdus indica]|uniref:bifunctional DNA-formamidopyrimidine glycosylase/DNA-(apurinic or apyrimidinic site) lyase n=1 Tax=Thiomicrorhabdus indica TaxID=2267253 RepID=UPI002AA71666|nr:bifunctional DNA-formamidopyrimidine glycosylase/DNA-(apurinic or apyrimidinic site) lyase [Thiomicrorhabdus indica]
MPELPEVETTCRGIQPASEQQIITKIVIRNGNLRWPVPNEIRTELIGQKVTRVHRRGKYILLSTPIGTLMIHLGMSGTLRTLPAGTDIKKHDHVDICFENDQILRLNDPRRFGSVHWQPLAKGEIEAHKLLAKLAPEPLSDEFNGEYFYQKAKTRSVAIKSLVMNSAVCVGAGNIYANESLFMSGIHPQTPAKMLSRKQCDLLVSNIKTVLAKAIEQGGTTLKDFMSPEGKPGYFVQELQVYDRENQPCRQCGTAIQRIILNQRASYFCPNCQTAPKRNQLKKQKATRKHRQPTQTKM